MRAAIMRVGPVGLQGVAGGFEALADPDAYTKILVEPA